MVDPAMLSSESDEWDTPQWLFDALDKEFGFTLDPCSNWDGSNAKCENHYSLRENGLMKDWGTEVVFVNPPYSSVADWVRKSYGSALEGATVVMLIPSRTDTKWWHKFCMKAEIRFLRGRLKFGDAEDNAPFSSAIIVFRPQTFRLLSFGS